MYKFISLILLGAISYGYEFVLLHLHVHTNILILTPTHFAVICERYRDVAICLCTCSR